MAIFDGSRYNNQPVYNVRRNARGDREPAIYHQGYYPQRFRYFEYQVEELERLDMIAYRLLGDAQMWWLLAVCNPDVFYPEVSAGTVIRIPQTEGSRTA